jgi:transcription factor STE12
MTSEEDLENEENEFGSLDDDLSSPEDTKGPEGIIPPMSTSMPPPSSLVMQTIPQPMMAPSQMIQPQLLQHTI